MSRMPPLVPEIALRMEEISKQISETLNINGPFNIQFLVDENLRLPETLVIEANLRASRSFPFVSKVMGENFIKAATEVMLGKEIPVQKHHDLKTYGIKVPHFSFTRLRQADPVLRVEMASTGEVACFGNDIYEAYLKAVLSTGISIPKKSALLSLGGIEGKMRLLPTVKMLHDLGFSLYATKNTADFLKFHGIPATFVYKVHENKTPNVVDVIRGKKVDLVVNLTDRSDLALKHQVKEVTDGYLIRRAAVEVNIPLFTKTTIANVFVESLSRYYNMDKLKIKSWDEYVKKSKFKNQRSKLINILNIYE